MPRKLSLIVFLLMSVIAVQSCTVGDKQKDNEPVKPERFLEKEELIEAMVDFRIAEASIRQMAAKGENTYKITPYYYKPMLEKHNLTIDQYYDNLSYYSRNPEMMDEIYKEVVNRLIEMQTQVRNQ